MNGLPTNDYGKFVMPVGKYKGEYLDDIPVNYLQWAYDTWDNMRPDLEKAIEAVLEDEG